MVDGAMLRLGIFEHFNVDFRDRHRFYARLEEDGELQNKTDELLKETPIESTVLSLMFSFLLHRCLHIVASSEETAEASTETCTRVT